MKIKIKEYQDEFLLQSFDIEKNDIIFYLEEYENWYKKLEYLVIEALKEEYSF